MIKIKENQKNKKLYKKFEVFDIETYIHAKKFRLSVVYDGKQYYRQRTVAELIAHFVYSPCNIYYAHYAGGFDTLWVLRELYKMSDFNKNEIEFFDSGGLIINFIFKFGNKKIEIRDSYALFRRKLDYVAEQLASKNKYVIDYENLDEYSNEQVYQHCENDCYILFESLQKFREIIGDELRLSIASQAMLFFRKNFLKYEWGKLSNFWDNILRSWYFGGRVDVFKRYGQYLTCYDINNCYGYTMKTFGAPVGLPKISKKYQNDKCNFIHCRIKNYQDFIPITPVKFQNKLFFPCLKNSDVYITNFEYAYLSDHIDKIYNVYCFDKADDFFSEYIDFWENLKNKDKSFKFISKLMMNSLYGKFAEKRHRKKLQYGEDLESYINNEFFLGYKNTEYIADYHNIQVGAWITSGARFLLYQKLKENENSLYYCDTDSITTGNTINVNSEIGQLKIEKEMLKGYFLGLKFYGYLNKELEFKSVVKGFEKNIFGIDKFENGLNDRLDFKYIHEGYRKLKSSLISANDFISYKYQEKEIQQLTIKRRLINKFETEPYTLINNNQLK